MYQYNLSLYATLLLAILHCWVFLRGGPRGHFTSARLHGSSLPLPSSVLFFRLCKWVFAVTPLNDNYIFSGTSYGFVAFTIFLVAFTMPVVLVVFVSLWIFDKLKAVFQVMERTLQARMGERREL